VYLLKQPTPSNRKKVVTKEMSVKMIAMGLKPAETYKPALL
jgi:hypothetical protein